MALTHQATNNFAGASASVDIGTAGNDRLLVIHVAIEAATVLTGLTVDGKAATLQVAQTVTSGLSNRSELWAIHEDQLGASNGSVTVALTGGLATHGTHVARYNGARQRDAESTYSGTGTSTTTVSVTGVNANVADLVIMTAGGGQSSGYSIDSWTSPLATLRQGVDATSMYVGTAGAVLTSALSSATLTATFNLSENRVVATAGVWSPAEIAGSGATTAPSQTGAGVGTSTVTSTGSTAAPAQTAAGAGTSTVTGTGATTSPAQTGAGIGTVGALPVAETVQLYSLRSEFDEAHNMSVRFKETHNMRVKFDDTHEITARFG